VLLPEVEPGDVLVAENAGPLWTPVFPMLGALVLDQGVLMQHAATTAREYGVPAVINVGNATRRIKDGDWLIVDGGAGTVDIDAASAG
jgi:phosphoenolpyruvate synthase/pyruvate phosphate dikinase